MAKPTLTINEQPSQLDYLIPVTLVINSDTEDVVISAQDTNIIEVDNDNKTIKGLKVGSTRITVTATSQPGESEEETEPETTVISWLCEVIRVATTLSVGSVNTNVTIGTEQSIEVTTNAQNGFSVISSDLDVIKPLNNVSPLQLYAIGLGDAVVTIKAKKDNEEEKSLVYHISVEEKEYVVEDGISVGIKLINAETNRTVNLTTTNNKSTEDITFYFPSRSGTVLTQEGLHHGHATMIDKPRIVSPLNNTENYTGIIIATSYATLLNYKGEHLKTKWQLTNDISFNVIQKEWVKTDGDLTRSYFMADFGRVYVRCKYYSEEYESEWSDPITFTNAVYNPENSTLEAPIKYYTNEAEKFSHSYFGLVPFTELVDNYRYRGNIMSIRKYFEYSRYYEGYGNIYDMISFKEGEQVTYNGKLYWTPVAQTVTERADGSKTNRNDMINPPTWDKLESLPKHNLMIKYLPLTIQIGKKYVIEVYTDAEDFILESANTTIMMIEEGDKTGEYRDINSPNKTDATGAKLFTLQGVNNGKAKIKFTSKVNEENNETPTYFTRVITVNSSNMVPRIPTPLNIDGVKYVVSKEDPNIELTLSTGTSIIPNIVNPDIFLLDESYLEYGNLNANGNYMQSSSVTTNNNTKTWTFSTNGTFYCQITTAANSSNGYATSTFFVVRSYGYENYWLLDQRTNLITPRSLLDKIGIGVGINDRNSQNTIGNPALGPLVNNEAGYHKYFYNGKLCFINAKPICNQIAWNDIAMRETAYKQRTLRCGTNLYWVRLPYKEELTTLFKSLSDGKFDSLDMTEGLGIEVNKPIWILDKKIGATRNILKWNGNEFIEEELDPKSRTGILIFVLEYIPYGQEPYNNIELCFPNVTKAEQENFEYDPVTDTGYFGRIKPEKFITYSQVRQQHTTGNASFNSDWLKFYWHGQILIAGRKTNSINASYNWIKGINGMYGFDTGGSGLTQIEVNNAVYRSATFMYSRRCPYSLNDVFGMGDHSNYTKLFPNIIIYGLCEYSMWNELMHRVATGYVGYTEVNGNEWYNGEIDEFSGFQIGDNWSNFPTFDQRNKNWQTNITSASVDGLQVNYDTEGNGCCSLFRDYSESKFFYAGPLGVAKACGVASFDGSVADYAWRNLLILPPQLD